MPKIPIASGNSNKQPFDNGVQFRVNRVDAKKEAKRITEKEHDEEIENESFAGLIIFVLITVLAICTCGYCILKHRGECFRKLSHEERDEMPIDGHSTRDMELSVRSRA